jgi:hypothetical protein
MEEKIRLLDAQAVRQRGPLGNALKLTIRNRLKKVDYTHLVDVFRHRRETDFLWRCEFWGKIVRSVIYAWRASGDEEQVAQCYGAVTAGCTGLEFYNGNICTLPNWRAFVRTNRELQSLTDVICSEEECEEVACDAINTPEAKLRHRTKKLNGEVYVISVNTGTEKMDKVAFTLPSGLKYDGDAEVLFEDRKLPLKGGRFTDEFFGHFRHVYKVKIK